MRSIYISLILFGLLPVLVLAQTNTYTYQRKLNSTEEEKYYSISLNPEIISRCKSNLNDIRIYDFSGKDTSEIPYVMERLGSIKEEKIIPFERINDTYNEKCCSYLTLKINKKQLINSIKLDVSDSNFDKRIKVEGSNDNIAWYTIREHLRIVRFLNKVEHFEYTTLDFPNTEYTYYRLKFDDEAGNRINITKAYAFEINETKGDYRELIIGSYKRVENKKERKSEIIVEFPFNYRVDHIILKSNTKKDFYRNTNVYKLASVSHAPNGDIENWNLIHTSIFSSTENKAVNCEGEQTQKLKIEILNQDDEPLERIEIMAFSEQYRLVAEFPVSDNLYLIYGKKNDKAPSYDLIHFKEKIPEKNYELNYESEQLIVSVPDTKNPLLKNKSWLWLSMGAVILLISFFSFKMLKNEKE